MPRLQKDTVDYFPHDALASAGDTLTVLQNRFGNNGYAVWFKLLEKLASTEGHYLDCRNPTKWQLLIAKMGVDEITTVEILNLLVEMQAIDKDLWESKLIWCQNLVDNLSEVYKNRRRELPQKPISTNNNGITTIVISPKVETAVVSTEKNTITTAPGTQSRVEYIRVDNIYIVIFDHWNTLGIINHKKLTSAMESAIDKAKKDYSQDEIKQAMSNYAEIVKGAEYYLNYRWTLAEFLSRNKGNNIERFLDLEIAKSNFPKEVGIGAHRGSPRSIPRPDEYTRPEEV